MGAPLPHQARKTSRQTVRWPVLPLPNSPGVAVSVDYFGPLPITARGNSYILLFTDRFRRRADMFAVTTAEFTAEGTANILVNRFIPLWGCPSTLLSDNGPQFCARLATAVYKLLGIHKLTTSAYHSSGNGGVERVNHTMAQMLAMVCNNSVSAATGLAPNEVHIGRLPRLPLTVFDRSYGGIHQNLDRDQLAYCDLAREHQQRAYELVREQHALTVARVNGRNSALSDALLRHPQYAADGWVWIYNTAATIRQGLRKGVDNKVLKGKLSLNWTGPFKNIAVGPAPAADTPDRRPLGDKLLYLDLPSNLSGPAAKPRVTAARCKPAPTHTMPQHTAAAVTFTAAPVAASTTAPVAAAAVPPAPLRPEHSAHAPLTTATSVAPRTLPQHTAAAVTFAAAPVAASTAAPVAASTAAPVAASAAAVLPAPLRQQTPALAPCTSAAFIAPTVPLRQQNPALAPCTCYGSDSALAPCTLAAFIAPTAPLRPHNSALAPCTSAAFIAPTVPIQQQNSALAPCTCYGSKTRPSRHVPRRLSSPPLCHYGNRTRPSRHVPATAATPGPRAIHLRDLGQRPFSALGS